MMVRRVIIANNRITDPKLNSKLAAVLAEANKMNVPKATLERAIARAADIKVFAKTLEIQGPSGSVVIAQCETDNNHELRKRIKKSLRKYDSCLLPEETVIAMFRSRGFIRASTKLKDNREVDYDFAEEAAIIASAEQVYLESNPDAQDEQLQNTWVFETDAATLASCRGELEKFGLQIMSQDLNLVPYNPIDFGLEVYEKTSSLLSELQDHEQVVAVFHNIKEPEVKEEQCAV